MVVGDIHSATTELIAQLWRERWGIPVVSVSRAYLPADVEGLICLDSSGQALGLVTWAVEGDHAEIVTLHAFVQGRHVGDRLLAEAERRLAARGVRLVTIVTSNDNLRALGFYVRRGYRLVRLHLDAMGRVRRVKPRVPEVGLDGIPLRDMWELAKEL